jgi:hypothetical protein
MFNVCLGAAATRKKHVVASTLSLVWIAGCPATSVTSKTGKVVRCA